MSQKSQNLSLTLLRKRSKRQARIVFIVLLLMVLLSPLELKGKIAWTVLMTACGVYTMLLRRARSGGIGSGAAGAFYEMLQAGQAQGH